LIVVGAHELEMVAMMTAPDTGECQQGTVETGAGEPRVRGAGCAHSTTLSGEDVKVPFPRLKDNDRVRLELVTTLLPWNWLSVSSVK
jgi:hypothetical protein